MQDLLSSLNDYCEAHSTLPDTILMDIERATHLKTLAPRMMSGHLQGSLLTMISHLVAPKYILEIGTFTGYSAICLAKGLQADGALTTIEYDPEVAEIAKGFFDRSTHHAQIQLVIGDAKKIIPDLNETFDLVFIDADKESYIRYFELVIDKCRSGSLILVDNVLWSGKVLDQNPDRKTKIIDAFNKKVSGDPRVENVILPIRDGINIIRKL